MKIVITGATGNIGTALLTALRGNVATADWEVHGVVRRPPGLGPPYDGVHWHAVDIAEPGAGTALRAVVHDADAMVHLAWAIQPSHDQHALRATNVDGSRRVFSTAAMADVPHLVHLSSVGAYGPGAGTAPVDESWPATGVGSSSYSRHKAAAETALDLLESTNPTIAVTRIRPALVMHRTAGSEIQRYFVGPVPGTLLRMVRRGSVPVAPLPDTLRLQVVHADDVAAGIIAALHTRLRGAVNLAADGVLTAADLADLVGGRLVRTPPKVLRSLLAAAWRVHAVPVSPGWLDLALAVPVMNTDRARTELGWAPLADARSTVLELFDGLADGSGHVLSPPLRPRELHHVDDGAPTRGGEL